MTIQYAQKIQKQNKKQNLYNLGYIHTAECVTKLLLKTPLQIHRQLSVLSAFQTLLPTHIDTKEADV